MDAVSGVGLKQAGADLMLIPSAEVAREAADRLPGLAGPSQE